MSDASSPRPCVLRHVVAVQGGGIDPSAADCRNAWIFDPTIIDGKPFADVYVGTYHCKKYLSGNFKMVEHIKDLRNDKVCELMQELSKEDDPDEENALDATLSTPKRELFDRLPSIITLRVVTTSGVTSVVVLPSWRTTGVLQIELTQSNLDLLLLEPTAGSAPWKPAIDHANVCWIASRSMVRCVWWDSKKHQYRIKSQLVKLPSEMVEVEKFAAVISAADKLQKFYDTHHNLEHNAPPDWEDIDPNEKGSAESAPGEPMPKVLKTD